MHLPKPITVSQKQDTRTSEEQMKSNKIHPSSPHQHQHHHLAALLPAAILSLAAALSPEETEVLAYLISCHTNHSGNHKTATSGDGDDDGGSVHAPVFGCDCFRCYTSFWSRWDASPNRDLIHEIIEAYEEGLSRKKSTKAKKRRKNSSNKERRDRPSMTEPTEGGGNGSGAPATGGGDGEVGSPAEKGSSVRKVIGFIGEKIWSAWNRE